MGLLPFKGRRTVCLYISAIAVHEAARLQTDDPGVGFAVLEELVDSVADIVGQKCAGLAAVLPRADTEEATETGLVVGEAENPVAVLKFFVSNGWV